MEDSTLRIIEGAAEFLWSEEIQNSLDTFATNHAPMFSDCTSAQDEQRLEWGEAHKDFQALVELHLERFLGTQSISAEEFVQACQDALDHGSWANCRGVVEVVLSMTTYEHFLQMMIAAAERKQKLHQLFRAGSTTSTPAARPCRPRAVTSCLITPFLVSGVSEQLTPSIVPFRLDSMRSTIQMRRRVRLWVRRTSCKVANSHSGAKSLAGVLLVWGVAAAIRD